MYHTKNCYQQCIEKKFLLNAKLWEQARLILAEMQIKSRIGRPSLDLKRAINGIYYLLKTGIIWKALPRCFGSSSAIHRTFQKLVRYGFFQKIWILELEQYDKRL
jgi:transposase